MGRSQLLLATVCYIPLWVPIAVRRRLLPTHI